MDAFEQIWETSRSNSWSWAYPTVLCFGVAVLAALSFVRNRWLRRTAKVIVILVFGVLATDFSAREIQEKWRIRGEWADAHVDQMTDAGWNVLTVDGANLTLGPLIYGFQAILLFVAMSIAFFVARKSVMWLQTQTTGPPNIDDHIATTLVLSDNPHNPPRSTT